MKKYILLSFITIILSNGNVLSQKKDIYINTIPYKLSVYNEPVDFLVQENRITLTAKGKTNLFNNPNGNYYVQDAPMLLFEPKGDFTLISRVTGQLKSIYDVAALVIYQHNDLWAKLCYEKSVDEKPTIVSVVTRKYSDDCNSEPTGSSAWLSIVRNGNIFKFYYSQDGQKWTMVRHFHLDITGKLKAGFASHGSRGDGFTAEFSDIRYFDKALDNMQE